MNEWLGRWCTEMWSLRPGSHGYFQWCSPGVTRGNGVIPLLSEGNYSFASVTEKVKRYLSHKVLPLPHCKFWDYITGYFSIVTHV